MKKEKVINLVSILFFYLILVLGVVILNARVECREAGEKNLTFER